MEATTVLTNNRNDEKSFSRLLGVLLNEGWIVDGIQIDGNSTTFDKSSYHVHLIRKLEIKQ